jgi:hypothetical protein
MEELGRAAIGECRRSRIVMRPLMPGKGVTLARIAVDYRVWFAGKSRLDLDLRRVGNELVLLSQMHKQGRMKIVDLAQVFFGVGAVIGDGRIDAAAHGRKERHQGAEAITLDSDLARALRQPWPPRPSCP